MHICFYLISILSLLNHNQPIVKFLLSSRIIVLYLEIFFHILKSYHETVLFEFEWKIQGMNPTGYFLNIYSVVIKKRNSLWIMVKTECFPQEHPPEKNTFTKCTIVITVYFSYFFWNKSKDAFKESIFLEPCPIFCHVSVSDVSPFNTNGQYSFHALSSTPARGHCEQVSRSKNPIQCSMNF